MMNVASVSQYLYPKLTLFLRLRIKNLFILVLILLLSGCSTDFFDRDSSQSFHYDSQKNAAYYLKLMEQSNDLSKTNVQLLAIRALLQEKRLKEAKTQLDALPMFLNSTQEMDKTLLLADLEVRQKSNVDLGHINENELKSPQKNYFYQIKLRKDKKNKDVNSVVRDYITLEKLTTQQDRAVIIDETWNYFKSLSDESLEKMVVFSHEMTLKGWYDLSYTYRQALKIETVPIFDEEKNTLEVVTPQLDKAERKTRIESVVSEWQMHYPSHPAALIPPKELQIKPKETKLVNQKGKKVALFLPLEGSSKVFGEVVKAGYSDASKFYPDEPVQTIMIFDTTSDSMAHLVSQAKAKGAELIVGPLLKEDVAKIAKEAGSLPILALNKLKSDPRRGGFGQNQGMMCYFGLSPEDEIGSAVRHIYHQGKRRPLIITSNNALGRRVAKAFDREWQRLYHSPVYVQYFESAQRLKEDMNHGIGLRVEGTRVESGTPLLDAYTSNDIDAIYIFSTQDELEFIKPMIDMQTHVDPRGRGKETVPLYTSSRSQNASGAPDYRYEMEQVEFSDIPLLVAKNPVLSTLPPSIQRDYSLARLYAMGIDAWRLANRFETLTKNKDLIIEGLTGIISVSDRCDIDRELPWRIYKQGQVRAVE